jgi:hypothetical protein
MAAAESSEVPWSYSSNLARVDAVRANFKKGARGRWEDRIQRARRGRSASRARSGRGTRGQSRYSHAAESGLIGMVRFRSRTAPRDTRSVWIAVNDSRVSGISSVVAEWLMRYDV